MKSIGTSDANILSVVLFILFTDGGATSFTADILSSTGFMVLSTVYVYLKSYLLSNNIFYVIIQLMQHSNIPLREPTTDNWSGTKNHIIRYYFYINTGLNVFNNFKYLVAAIIGIYWTLHLHAPILLILMFLGSIPILGVMGYYSIHHINRVIDWLNIRFGSHYGIYQITLLEEIRDALQDTDKYNTRS